MTKLLMSKETGHIKRYKLECVPIEDGDHTSYLHSQRLQMMGALCVVKGPTFLQTENLAALNILCGCEDLFKSSLYAYANVPYAGCRLKYHINHP